MTIYTCLETMLYMHVRTYVYVYMYTIVCMYTTHNWSAGMVNYHDTLPCNQYCKEICKPLAGDVIWYDLAGHTVQYVWETAVLATMYLDSSCPIMLGIHYTVMEWTMSYSVCAWLPLVQCSSSWGCQYVEQIWTPSTLHPASVCVCVHVCLCVHMCVCVWVYACMYI